MVAEYSTIVEPQATAKISYLTNDHLGSPRIITDQNGAIISRRDFMPLGEEIQRTNYGNDNVREKFATYERDAESNLEFAQARMYAKNLGRFTSVDPIILSKEHKVNPQRWNLYIYVINCPTGYIDPDGKNPKRKVIDIFIVITDKQMRDNGFKKKFDDLKKLGKDKNIKVNIYTLDEGTASIKTLRNSLDSKGRTVVIVGHSMATTQDQERSNNGGKLIGTGIQFSDGELVSTYLIDNKNQKIFMEKIKASEVTIFTCNNGAVDTDFAKRMNGELITFDNGIDGKSTIIGGANAAYAVVETLINGGDMKDASEAAQKEIDATKSPTEGRKKHQGDILVEGDGVIYQDLRKRND